MVSFESVTKTFLSNLFIETKMVAAAATCSNFRQTCFKFDPARNDGASFITAAKLSSLIEAKWGGRGGVGVVESSLRRNLSNFCYNNTGLKRTI